MERARRAALDLLFPPRCALCDTGGAMLCVRCADRLPLADGRRCVRCWLPIARGDRCRQCVVAPPPFASLRAGCTMDDGARRLTHELKYEGMTALAEPMARLMLELCELSAADAVVPVPLHRTRERGRGYNQAAELARHLAAGAGIRLERRAVRRVRATAPLAKTMHREERFSIMRGAFGARRELVEGRDLLLVDDVATTGATLSACTEALLAAGARRVACLVWARAS
jgi:ComF family protein